MSFEDDEARWTQFLEGLHRLSLARFTGRIVLNFHHGRVSRSTLKTLADMIAFRDYTQEGARHAKA